MTPLRWCLAVPGWLAFLFLLLQGAGWFAFEVAGIRPIGGYGYPPGLYSPHPAFGYLYTPGFRGRFSGEAYADVAIAINAHGFRDRAFGPPRGTRIVALGDSVVFGAGVPSEARFTERLAARLRQGGNEVEILNLGVNSWTFGHYLAVARQDYLGLAPDAVLLGLTLNDILPMDAAGPLRRVAEGTAAGPAPLLTRFRWWWDRTYSARFVHELEHHAKAAVHGAGLGEAYHSRWMRSIVDHWRDPARRAALARELDALLQDAAARRLVLGVVLFPERNELQDPSRYGLPRRTLMAMLAARGVDVCDPAPAFAAAASPDALFLTNDSVHYTPAGHALIADTLADCLHRWNWSP